jgi:hypothetical protein
MRLPRGQSITLDGRVDSTEWSGARRIEHPPGTVVNLMRDDSFLYIGISSDRPGFISLCIGRPDEVFILHASAALGAVTYRQDDGIWSSADSAFRYGMRNRSLDDAAQRERTTYLSEHGWVASTILMTEGRSQEMQIALGRFAPPFSLALGRFLLAGGNESWPSTIDATDGCVDPTLVRGAVPRALRFDSSRWIRIDQ